MVPNLSKGAGIKGTALYVLHDVRDEGERAIGAALTPDQQSTARVGMTATRNLSTDDPELAWRLMCATAQNRETLKEAAGVHKGGRPSKYQCGHIALSWEHETRPDRAEMLRAAEGALTSLGWDQLQALIVEHHDHDHAHCHVVVNLVDPETGRTAPNAKNDYEKLQRWAHQYDKERGLEVCPQRAARIERAPDDPTPPTPAVRWLSRKEFEAIRTTERAEDRAQALDRYREAAAAVREQFRPEWSEHYRAARAELRALDQQQRTTMRQLDQAATVRTARVQDAGERGWIGPAQSVRNRMAEFVNAHRETIWRGIDEASRPGNQQALLKPAFVKRALEHAHAGDRAAMLERQEATKGELQGRHTEARQDAYRQAWQRPEPASPGAQQGDPAHKTDRADIGRAAAQSASAAGIAANANQREQKHAGDRHGDPERGLADAAERIRRQQSRAANANDIARELKKPEPKPEPAKRDEVAILRARIERERNTRQQTRDPARDFERHRTRSRD